MKNDPGCRALAVHFQEDLAKQTFVRDFRSPSTSTTVAQRRGALIRRLLLLQVLGLPLLFGAVFAGMAYFGAPSSITLFEDPQTAGVVLIACGAGLLVEGWLTLRSVMALNALKSNRAS